MIHADDVYDPPEQWHIYYCYAADGALLYVGCSREPENRMYLHRQNGSEWWPFCDLVVVSDPMRRTDAYELERLEIATHGPVFNVLHNVDPVEWTPAAVQMGRVEIRRLESAVV